MCAVIIAMVATSAHTNLTEAIKLYAYMALLVVAGLGIIKRIPSTASWSLPGRFAVAWLLGVAMNSIVFFMIRSRPIPDFVSVWIAAGIGAVLLARRVSWRVTKPKDGMLVVAVILFFVCALVTADNIYYSADGVYVMDSNHPTYEMHIASSLDTMYPVEDYAYLGKDIRYHFAYPIIAQQLTHSFGQDTMLLIYRSIPLWMIALFIILIYEISRAMRGAWRRTLFMCLMLFSTLSVPIRELFIAMQKLIGISLPVVQDSPAILYRLTFMGSYGLGILYVVALFLAIRIKKRSLILETIILTGMALAKVPFFIACCFAYAGYSLMIWIRGRDFAAALRNGLVLAPGALSFLLFSSGAHKHNLWILFPAWLNLKSTTLSRSLLLPNASLSGIVYILLFIGIGAFFLWPTMKTAFKHAGKKRGDPLLLPILIILSSMALILTLTEATESNSIQFVYPGYIFLCLLTYPFLLFKKGKTWPTILVLALIVNAGLLVGVQYLSSANKTYAPVDDPRNALANAKITMVRATLGPSMSSLSYSADGCYFPDDLLNGLGYLSLLPEGNVVFSRMYEPCENSAEVRWRAASFIRSA
ncbi:MAG: hypothetical protein ABIH41_02235, partial [Nanoarchaeota archaeon]